MMKIPNDCVNWVVLWFYCHYKSYGIEKTSSSCTQKLVLYSQDIVLFVHSFWSDQIEGLRLDSRPRPLLITSRGIWYRISVETELAGAFRCWMQDTGEKPSRWGRMGKQNKWVCLTPAVPPVMAIFIGKAVINQSLEWGTIVQTTLFPASLGSLCLKWCPSNEFWQIMWAPIWHLNPTCWYVCQLWVLICATVTSWIIY